MAVLIGSQTIRKALIRYLKAFIKLKGGVSKIRAENVGIYLLIKFC